MQERIKPAEMWPVSVTCLWQLQWSWIIRSVSRKRRRSKRRCGHEFSAFPSAEGRLAAKSPPPKTVFFDSCEISRKCSCQNNQENWLKCILIKTLVMNITIPSSTKANTWQVSWESGRNCQQFHNIIMKSHWLENAPSQQSHSCSLYSLSKASTLLFTADSNSPCN